MAFDSLSDKLQNIFKNLRGKGRLSEADVKAALKEVKMALLEADVNFKVVKNFLLLDDYNQLLLSANIFIYGNWRQEAVGNILIALYLGGKVFLDKRNPLLNFYKSLGLTLFDIEELSDEHLNSKLSSETINDNRKILKQFYSKERLISLIRENF